MIGNLEMHEIEEVLHQQVIGRIACHADGETYIVPVSYAYDGRYIYTHTRPGKKISMMNKNPHVCFETEEFINMANWKSVIAWGNFEEVKLPAERHKAIQILLDRILPLNSSETTHLSPHWPFPPHNNNEIKGIVYRVELIRKTGRFEKNYENASYTI
ncbi:MAG: pyridoxamine 5'-phosphate oxidase family protein [Flavitalea sp.]